MHCIEIHYEDQGKDENCLFWQLGGGRLFGLFPGIESGFGSVRDLKAYYLMIQAWASDEDYGYSRWADPARGGAMYRLARPDESWWINLDGGEYVQMEKGVSKKTPNFVPLWQQPWVDPNRHVIDCDIRYSSSHLPRRYVAVPRARIAETARSYWGRLLPAFGLEAYCVQTPDKSQLLAIKELGIERQAAALFEVCPCVVAAFPSEYSNIAILTTQYSRDEITARLDVPRLYHEAGLRLEDSNDCV